MPTKALKKADRDALKRLGEKLRDIILKERKYKSLDAFAMEFHDDITKPTLYQICDGKRDMKISTLMGLARALEIPIEDLIRGLA